MFSPYDNFMTPWILYKFIVKWLLILFNYSFVFCYIGLFLFLFSTISNRDLSQNMTISSFMKYPRLCFFANQLYAMPF